MPRKPEPLPPDEHDVVVGDALDNLLELTRDQALRIALGRVRLPWVRAAARAGVLEAVCLGRFDLVNPDRRDVPWPSVVFVLSRPKSGLQAAACCAAALYWAPAGDWEVSEREPVDVGGGDRRLLIDWTQYRGDQQGAPSLVNGDRISREDLDVGAVPSIDMPDEPEPDPERPLPLPSPPPAAPSSADLRLRVLLEVLRLLNRE